MSRDALPPIPTPPALRWREFRVRFLPALLFLAALGGVAFIWQRNVSAPMFVGAVEGRAANVASPYAAKILQLDVDRFQTVKQGTPLAVLMPTDPRTALSAVQSELDVLRARLDSYLTRQRNATDYEKLRLDWLGQRVDLATARANWQGARDALYRDKSLHAQKLISDDIYELAETLENALSAEVLERSNLVQQTESGMQTLIAANAPTATNDFAATLDAAIQAEEQKLKTVAGSGAAPVTLVAPMDGMVSFIYHQAGENIPEGDPIMVISGTRPERIVAYLRQPVAFEPKVGETVQVRTRTLQRQMSLARIASVGAQFEPITNSLAIAHPYGMIDYGLPVEVTLPPGLNLRPGETVDLALMPPN